MTVKNVVRNYTTALFNNAKNNNSENEVLEQITIIAGAINENNEIKKTFSSPIVDKQNKIQIIGVLAKKFDISKYLHNFFLLLIKNSRMNILSEIVTEFYQMLLASNNIKMVEVISARTLLPKEKEWFKIFVEKVLNQEAELTFAIDPVIIGGILVKYDSILQDYSIKGSLAKISKTLKSVKIAA